MWLCPVPYILLTQQLNAGSPLDDSGGGLVLDRDPATGLPGVQLASWRSIHLRNVLKIASCRFLENVAVLLSPRELVGGKA